MSLQHVQKICCINQGAFVIGFDIQYLDPSTKEWVTIPGTSTGYFPVGQAKTVDMSQYTFPQTALLRPHVIAKGGGSITPDEYVLYAHNDETATYIIRGGLIHSVMLAETAEPAR